MARTNQSMKNVFFNISNQLLNIILAFVSRTVFISTLGVELLGINGLFTDILGLLCMADLGIGTAMVYSFYKPLAENDYDKMAALVCFYKKVYNFIALTVTVVGIVIIPFLQYIVNLEKDVPNLEIYYLFSLASTVVTYLCVYKTSILTADQNNYVVTRITMIINVIKTILQIITLYVFKNYIIYLLIASLGSILINIVASNTATKKYPFVNKKISLDKEDRKDIFSNIKSVFIFKISSVLLNATDNILISVIVGTIIVGYYSNYLMIVNKITTLYAVLFSSLTASIGNLIVRENAKKRYEIFQCEQSVSYVISSIIIPCFAVLINDFIKVWLGVEYTLGIGLVIAVCLNMYLSCVLQPLWSYREATGLYKKTKWVMVICAVINIILSIILGKVIGLEGIILASGISRIVTYVWYEPIFLFKEYFNKSTKDYFKSLIFNMIFVGVLMCIGLLTMLYWEVHSIMQLIVKAIVSGGIVFLLTIVVYYKSEGLQIFKEKMKKFVFH